MEDQAMSKHQHQYSLTLIQREFNNSIIEQRSDDGYINATALCAAAGKRWYNYVRNESTGHFLRAHEAMTEAKRAIEAASASSALESKQ